ncbi:MAG: YggW family oxidoreductase, partial [Buchnera aphidicola]|nr:YggW family oxidoreductase [Buchnera aphidicola]
YNSQEAINAINIAKKKYSNLNLDLMYGLPSQSLKDALYDLNNAIKHNPNHISWYQMTIEPNTEFYKNTPKLPHEDIIFQMFTQGHKLLTKSGYKRYEISSYAKNHYKCQHNLNYWQFGDYIGIGCGAHGKITKKDGNIIRIIKNKNPYKFMHEKYVHTIKTIPKKDI